MSEKSISDVDAVMDVGRTNGLFDASINRAESLKKEPYTEEDIKKQRLVIGFGNLHINTAKTKLSAVRMFGYRNTQRLLKEAVQKKIRKASRP